MKSAQHSTLRTSCYFLLAICSCLFFFMADIGIPFRKQPFVLNSVLPTGRVVQPPVASRTFERIVQIIILFFGFTFIEFQTQELEGPFKIHPSIQQIVSEPPLRVQHYSSSVIDMW